MKQWRLGDCLITRIEEMYLYLDPANVYPEFDPMRLEQHRDWLDPRLMIEGDKVVISIHSWLIQTPTHNVLVDSCTGNDKERGSFSDWHRLSTPYMDHFEATGLTPEDIDYVLCTHLHVDHVGWNTRLTNGQWVPTFPNAKYLFSDIEYQHWDAKRKAPAEQPIDTLMQSTFDDSIMPILHLAELIHGEHELLADCLVLQPTPGHTPGSICVSLRSGGEEALFTGDITNHPLQVYEPDWNSFACELPDQAIATRYAVLNHCLDHGSLMLPAHFSADHAGFVRASDRNFEFEFLPGMSRA